jgi:hypothetical protein
MLARAASHMDIAFTVHDVLRAIAARLQSALNIFDRVAAAGMVRDKCLDRTAADGGYLTFRDNAWAAAKKPLPSRCAIPKPSLATPLCVK